MQASSLQENLGLLLSTGSFVDVINLSFLLPANAICKLVGGLASSSSVLTIASSLQFVLWYAAVLSYAETSVVTSQLTQAVSLSL